MGISNCYNFCDMGRSKNADQEIIDVIDELIWNLEDFVDRVAKRQAHRGKKRERGETEDFIKKFFNWYHGKTPDWNGVEERARKKLIAKRQKAHREAHRKKVLAAWNPAHPDMVWAVNKSDEIFYRNGTHEDNNSAGHGWQKLPGALKWVSAGKNAVWGVNEKDQIYCLSPIVLNGDQLDFSKMDWKHIANGLQQISASKNSDAIWGVSKHGICYYKLNSNSPWEVMGSGLMQVAVGNAGVYGLSPTHCIFYRNGTHAKPDSKGTGWTYFPGALKNIMVGRNAVWGANKKAMIYWAACNSSSCKN